ncbi:beta-lactamase [Lichtheimia corymbifera JMRC:FSU:9682]|nr:beta-lactamase [Lichtheimia corymbifera JMRC:FSU:9682]
MHGGWQDIEKKIPYTSNTLQIVYSSTKMLTAIVVAQLVEKGYLSYDEKITRYWPEFGQGNKMNVTLGDLMQHAGGVGFLDSPISLAATQDPVRFSEILASQPHNFDGNRTRSYHAATRGWYLNEIIRRVTPENYTVNTWAEKYINQVYKDIEWQLKPYAECYDDRVAPIYRGPRLHRFYRKLLRVLKHGRQELSVMAALNDPDSPAHKTMRSVITGMGRTDVTSLAYRRLESPSFSGFTNAKSIAKLAAMMANQGKAIDPDEPDLLNTTTYAHVTEPVPLDYDILIRKSTPALKGGFGVMDDLTMDNVTFVGWTGMGGSIFFWNPEYKIAFGYCTNSMASFNPADERSMSILRAIVKQVLKSH